MKQLFGVNLPKIKKSELTKEIKNLPKNSKKSLFFLYSELLLKANRNRSHQIILNNSDFNPIDGRGMEWILFRRIHKLKLSFSKLFSKFAFQEKKSLIFGAYRLIIFPFFFTLQLFANFLDAFLILISKKNLSKITNNELVLGRDYIYDLLKIGEENKWKVAIIGGNDEAIKNIQKKFPKIEVEGWFLPSDSDLMKDIPNSKNIQNLIPKLYGLRYPDSHTWLKCCIGGTSVFPAELEYTKQYDRILNRVQDDSKSQIPKIIDFDPLEENPQISAKFDPLEGVMATSNLYSLFPDLKDAEKFLEKSSADLVLVCIGGASGKQEAFIYEIKQNPKIQFRLAAGMGAAIDHLGGGKKQKPSPKFMQKMGLEWLFRFVTLPYRRKRVLDSVFSLFWWFTVQDFLDEVKHLPRQTAVGIVENKKGEILLLRRKNWLPGDIDWTFVQGKIENGEEPKDSIIREVEEEAGLEKENLKIQKDLGKTVLENHTASVLRFMAHEMNSSVSQHHLFHIIYSGKKDIKINWEHIEGKWIPKNEVPKYLAVEKLGDFEVYLKSLS